MASLIGLVSLLFFLPQTLAERCGLEECTFIVQNGKKIPMFCDKVENRCGTCRCDIPEIPNSCKSYCQSKGLTTSKAKEEISSMEQSQTGLTTTVPFNAKEEILSSQQGQTVWNIVLLGLFGLLGLPIVYCVYNLHKRVQREERRFRGAEEQNEGGEGLLQMGNVANQPERGDNGARDNRNQPERGDNGPRDNRNQPERGDNGPRDNRNQPEGGDNCPRNRQRNLSP